MKTTCMIPNQASCQRLAYSPPIHRYAGIAASAQSIMMAIRRRPKRATDPGPDSARPRRSPGHLLGSRSPKRCAPVRGVGTDSAGTGSAHLVGINSLRDPNGCRLQRGKAIIDSLHFCPGELWLQLGECSRETFDGHSARIRPDVEVDDLHIPKRPADLALLILRHPPCALKRPF